VKATQAGYLKRNGGDTPASGKLNGRQQNAERNSKSKFTVPLSQKNLLDGVSNHVTFSIQPKTGRRQLQTGVLNILQTFKLLVWPFKNPKT